MLMGLWDGLALVMARDAHKALGYSCPECGADLVLRQGAVVVHHFAHRIAAPRCEYAAGETVEHMTGKQILHDALVRRGLRAEVECRVETPLGPRRADVMAFDGKHRIAFEIQHSEITVEDLARRTRSYMSAGIRVIWVPLVSGKVAAALRRPHPRRSWTRDIDTTRWAEWHYWLSAYQQHTAYLDVEREEVFSVNVTSNNWYGPTQYSNWIRGPWRLDDLAVLRFWAPGKGYRWSNQRLPVKGPAARLKFPPTTLAEREAKRVLIQANQAKEDGMTTEQLTNWFD